VAICQHVYSSVTGVRAVEALASGIPIVTEALAEAGLPAARYMDSGIRFTVMLSQPAVSGNEKIIYGLLAHGPRTVAALENATGIPAYTIRRVLRSLRAAGLIEQEGGRGQATTYRHIRRR
jgi:ATP-dependent DNA helicase RecG